MNDWKRWFKRLLHDERGATSMEYALMGSLIAIVCIATLVALGANVDGLYINVCNQVSSAISHAPSC